MKNTITYAQALEMAIKVCSAPANVDDFGEVIQKLTSLKEKYEKPRTTSDEAKAKASAKRKEQTAKARMELCAQVMPILREIITHDMTAKEIFEAAKERLPEGFTAPKVQNILIREMAPELIKTEAKGKANTYRMA